MAFPQFSRQILLSTSEWEKCKYKKAKYTVEFKEKAVRQVIDRGHSVINVAKRLGIGDGLLYTWVKKFKDANEPVSIDDLKFILNPAVTLPL